MDIEKFKEKNVGSYMELDSLLKMKDSDIRYIVVSNELTPYLIDKVDVVNGGSWLWNGKIMIPNPYQASGRMDFILNNGVVYTIRFNMPCICGIYKDEKHP